MTRTAVTGDQLPNKGGWCDSGSNSLPRVTAPFSICPPVQHYCYRLGSITGPEPRPAHSTPPTPMLPQIHMRGASHPASAISIVVLHPWAVQKSSHGPLEVMLRVTACLYVPGNWPKTPTATTCKLIESTKQSELLPGKRRARLHDNTSKQDEKKDRASESYLSTGGCSQDRSHKVWSQKG